jgi:hypothetical protein
MKMCTTTVAPSPCHVPASQQHHLTPTHSATANRPAQIQTTCWQPLANFKYCPVGADGYRLGMLRSRGPLGWQPAHKVIVPAALLCCARRWQSCAHTFQRGSGWPALLQALCCAGAAAGHVARHMVLIMLWGAVYMSDAILVCADASCMQCALQVSGFQREHCYSLLDFRVPPV